MQKILRLQHFSLKGIEGDGYAIHNNYNMCTSVVHKGNNTRLCGKRKCEKHLRFGVCKLPCFCIHIFDILCKPQKWHKPQYNYLCLNGLFMCFLHSFL